ncbi:hypothetical protein T4D_5860 [Trichinella pseudospiralis]|uniref:PiggyBac transposable element-derived protein domain-containing protein n=1 Tax=Trichinella pseudospiralis TaxID=6337 RepID=A0A0V1FC67_TRIPS|nr:hypothetical protein T4D_5860 [Trichinella pseudospiralis]
MYYDTDGKGIEIFLLNASRLFLLRCTRFDYRVILSERKLQDKRSPIRMVFDSSARNCTENCTSRLMKCCFPSNALFACISSPRLLNMASNFFKLSDSETYYVSTMEMHVGKQNEGPHQISTSPAAVVKRLCCATAGSKRDITMDNWFMSNFLKSGQ